MGDSGISGSWVDGCRVRKVRQRDPFGCGVACVAMVTGRDYPTVRQMFLDKQIGRCEGRPLSTNFTELQRALALLGVPCQRKRFEGWDSIQGVGIVAVDSFGGGSKNWHWVVVERHERFGIVLHDPDFPLPSFSGEVPPGVMAHPFTEYQARKSWLRISDNLGGRKAQSHWRRVLEA